MREGGFTLIEVILLVALIGILSVPLASLTSSLVVASKNSTDLYKETNEIHELSQQIYYMSAVDLLEGVSISRGGINLEARAIEDETIREARDARKRMGKNLYKYRRLNIGVKVYRADKLVEEFNISRFGLVTEEEEVYHEKD